MTATSMIEGFRQRLGAGVREIVSGAPDTPRPASRGGNGLAGPGSAMQAVHGDVSGLVGGLRALLMQTLHPLAIAGVADHSGFRRDPLGRLHRTGEFLAATTFGTEAEAEAAIESVRRVHARVAGTAPDGRPYSACDPHLLAWVHCTEVDGFLRARVRYGASPLPDGAPDRYVAEMAEIGRRLGVESPPRDVAGLKTRLWTFRAELAVNHQARDAVRFLIWPPTPAAARGPYLILFAAAAGLLPVYARRMLRLPLAPLTEPVLIRPAATALLRTLGWALSAPPAPTTATGEPSVPSRLEAAS